jgi:phosphoserine phosphatase RsbU/P
VVGDVSGKSLPAAMLMAVARSTARSEARNHETPWVVLTETNRWLVDDVPHNSFVALSYALIDVDRGRLVLASAGQLTPLLRHTDGTTSFIDSPQSLPLGLSDQAEFGQTEITIGPGDTIVFYTDGIVEAHDQCRELFGFERLERLLQAWGHLPPLALIDRIVAEVHAFSEGMPTHDDMTLVVVRVS